MLGLGFTARGKWDVWSSVGLYRFWNFNVAHVYAYLYICIYIYIYMHIYIYIERFLYTCVYIYTHIFIYAHLSNDEYKNIICGYIGCSSYV